MLTLQKKKQGMGGLVQVIDSQKLYAVLNIETGKFLCSGRNYTPAVYEILGSAKRMKTSNEWGSQKGKLRVVTLKVGDFID